MNSPPDLDTLIAQAETEFAAGDLAAAYSKAGFAIANGDRHARAHFLMAQIALAKGARRDAQALAARASGFEPDSAEFASLLAVCCLENGDLVAAWDAVEAIDSPDGLAVPVLRRLVQAFHALSLYERARDCARTIARLEPDDAATQATLGSLLAICGDGASAQAAFRAAIGRDPDNIDALANLSAARTASSSDNNVAAMEALAQKIPDPFERARLHYAIAKERDDLGDPAGLFEHLERGKRIWREASGFDSAADQRMFRQLEETFAIVESLPAPPGADRPIFITGMPRSGTTLVERIVTRDPAVRSLGETPALAFALNAQVGNPTARMFDADRIGRTWNTIDPDRIARDYGAFVNRLSGPGGRPLDKTPLNALLIPLIVAAMPQARIVHLQRGHMDTVLGNYRTPFAPHNHSFGYASSLETTHGFANGLAEWAARCAARYPGQVMVVHYERLVADPEAEAQAIYAFLGLAWDAAAIDIVGNTAPAASASALQVRSPIHDRSVGQWHRYAPWLGAEPEG